MPSRSQLVSAVCQLISRETNDNQTWHEMRHGDTKHHEKLHRSLTTSPLPAPSFSVPTARVNRSAVISTARAGSFLILRLVSVSNSCAQRRSSVTWLEKRSLRRTIEVHQRTTIDRCMGRNGEKDEEIATYGSVPMV